MEKSVEVHAANGSLVTSLSLLLYVFISKFIFFTAESATHAVFGPTSASLTCTWSLERSTPDGRLRVPLEGQSHSSFVVHASCLASLPRSVACEGNES